MCNFPPINFVGVDMAPFMYSLCGQLIATIGGSSSSFGSKTVFLLPPLSLSPLLLSLCVCSYCSCSWSSELSDFFCNPNAFQNNMLILFLHFWSSDVYVTSVVVFSVRIIVFCLNIFRFLGFYFFFLFFFGNPEGLDGSMQQDEPNSSFHWDIDFGACFISFWCTGRSPIALCKLPVSAHFILSDVFFRYFIAVLWFCKSKLVPRFYRRRNIGLSFPLQWNITRIFLIHFLSVDDSLYIRSIIVTLTFTPLNYQKRFYNGFSSMRWFSFSNHVSLCFEPIRWSWGMCSGSFEIFLRMFLKSCWLSALLHIFCWRIFFCHSSKGKRFRLFFLWWWWW